MIQMVSLKESLTLKKIEAFLEEVEREGTRKEDGSYSFNERDYVVYRVLCEIMKVAKAEIDRDGVS